MNITEFRRARRYFMLLLVVGYSMSGYFLLTSITVFNRTETVIQRANGAGVNVNLKESGVIETNSQWRKLGQATYVFTAYLDDRNPDYVLLTVLGFDSHSEPLLNGTLLLHSGERLPLGKCKTKRTLHEVGSVKRLRAYAYNWPLPAQVTNVTHLKAIYVEQFHPTKGKTETEIEIRLPAHSAKKFGVCIDSPLFGNLKTKAIIENIEINKVLGAEWFTFYIYKADQTVIEVLHEYASEGTVEVVENWGDGLPKDNSIPHSGQSLSIYECAYRNMHRVKYLVYTDLDEFIVPRKSIGWSDMMKQMENEKYGSYIFRNAFFFERNINTTKDTGKHEFSLAVNGTCNIEMPKFLTHLFRSPKVWDAGRRSKYIIKPLCTQLASILVHQVRHSGNYARYVVPPEYALLNHYRKFRRNVVPFGENVKDLRILDEHTFAYQEKIVTTLNKRLCGIKPVLGK